MSTPSQSFPFSLLPFLLSPAFPTCPPLPVSSIPIHLSSLLSPPLPWLTLWTLPLHLSFVFHLLWFIYLRSFISYFSRMNHYLIISHSQQNRNYFNILIFETIISSDYQGACAYLPFFSSSFLLFPSFFSSIPWVIYLDLATAMWQGLCLAPSCIPASLFFFPPLKGKITKVVREL